MRLLLNIIWFVFGGFWLALGYAFAALICFILIITIPFGIASFRLAGYALWPFGRRVVVSRGAGVMSVIGNVLWVVLLGWELFLAHLVAGALLCLTVVGIPLGVASFKMAVLALIPLGTRVVDADLAEVPGYRYA